ncbi:MAG: ribosome silencing factor [Candidatus Kapabacteria bacterium]|nr:ribosome silencing factor [Candidatus Kapabacteria bacterium]
MLKQGKPRSSKGLATFCARIADDKIAKNILILDLKTIDMSPSEYFVICTSDSVTQVRAISDEIYSKSKEVKIQTPKVEGMDTANWVIMDFFDVVVHIMTKEAREFYQLERLWGDSDFYSIDEAGKPVKLKDYKPDFSQVIESGEMIHHI